MGHPGCPAQKSPERPQNLLLSLPRGMDPALTAPWDGQRLPTSVFPSPQPPSAARQRASMGMEPPWWHISKLGPKPEQGSVPRRKGEEKQCVPSQALLLLPPLLPVPSSVPLDTLKAAHSPMSILIWLGEAMGSSWRAAHTGGWSGHSSSLALSLSLHSASPTPWSAVPGSGFPPRGPHPTALRGKDALKAAWLLAKVLKEIIACIKIFSPAKGLKPFP